MKRALSIWLPMWPIDRVRRRWRRCGEPHNASSATQRILLVRQDGQRQIVARCCEHALTDGVRAGMSEAEARSLVFRGDGHVQPFTPEQDQRALHALALWAQRFSPLVAVDGEDGLLIDITGCERVFDGEERLLSRVFRDFDRLSIRVRAAIAPTFACAWAVCRFGRVPIVPDDSQQEAVKPLPVAALGLDEGCLAALEEVGIERIGDLFELPRAVLPARFGEQLLLRLDQVLGRALEIIDPVRLVDPPCVERLFDGPTTCLEGIELTVRDLIAQLCHTLHALEAGVRRLDIELTRADLPPVRLTFPLSRVSRNVRHLWSLVQPRLEKVQLGYGAERIVLLARQTERLSHEQVERWRVGSTQPDAALERACGELIDTLTSRLGSDCVQHTRLIESHDPRRAGSLQPLVKWGRTEEPVDMTAHDRPTMLFGRSRPAQVTSLMPDGPVMHFRMIDQETRQVVSTIGPERIGPEWWRGVRETHDYFRVQEQSGRWWWLSREQRTGRWFAQGAWA